MATIHISESTHKKLQELADERQMPLEKFLDSVASVTVRSPSKVIPIGTPEWMAAFDSWIASHKPLPYIADDSRDAIYGEEGD